MKLRELYAEFGKDYDIVVFGRPLKQKTIPFTLLPYDKELKDCEVVEMQKVDKEFVRGGISFRTMKKCKPKKFKGSIYVYVK